MTKIARARRSVRVRFQVVQELFSYLLGSRRFALVPLVAAMLLCSVLLIAVSLVEYVAPFVYTIF